jgi:hypothetical protein
MSAGAEDVRALEAALERLQALTEALDAVRDPAAREAARSLTELLLDLHGIAFARATAIVAVAPEGPALIDAFATDPHLRAMLLLHGLHPHDAKRRLTDVIARMRPQWQARGFAVDLMGLENGAAHLILYAPDPKAPAEAYRVEVERELVDAAPDLDSIQVEIAAVRGPASALSMVG